MNRHVESIKVIAKQNSFLNLRQEPQAKEQNIQKLTFSFYVNF